MTYIENKTEAELVDDIGSTVIGTPSGLKAQFTQAELTRRLIVSIRNLDRTTSLYSKIIIVLTLVLSVLAGVQIWLAKKQTDYTEIQSRSDRIKQAQMVQNAIKLCEQSPELKESGLYNVSNGNSASCSEVFKTYKK